MENSSGSGCFDIEMAVQAKTAARCSAPSALRDHSDEGMARLVSETCLESVWISIMSSPLRGFMVQAPRLDTVRAVPGVLVPFRMVP